MIVYFMSDSLLMLHSIGKVDVCVRFLMYFHVHRLNFRKRINVTSVMPGKCILM